MMSLEDPLNHEDSLKKKTWYRLILSDNKYFTFLFPMGNGDT